jgi:hypothetical protein
MSYSASFTVGGTEDDPASVSDGLDAMPRQQSPDGVDAAFDEHVAAIDEALNALAPVVGRQGKYRVNVSGHANPDHTPLEGWADEFITLTITALHEQPESVAAETNVDY